MKKLLIGVASLALVQAAAAEDIAWRDVEPQQTPIGAGSSATVAFAAFDSWGRKDLVADGPCGTGLAPFVSRFVAAWTSDAISIDLCAPGLWLFLR